jgi:UDP-glucose 4-epimerase
MQNYYKNKNILITGGAGFIGSELSSQLSKICKKLTIVDNLVNGKLENINNIVGDNVIFHNVDVRDTKQMSLILDDIDVVFHLACLGVRHSIHSPYENHEVNASATLNLLRISKEKGVIKFLYVSTSEVYGNNVSVPISEKHQTFPATVYGASKLAGEAYCRAYWDTYDFPTVIIRPFNSFGPNSHHEGDSGEVIPKFMLKCMVDDPLIIHGDGKQTRDFTYVSDTARGIMLGGYKDSAIGKTINIGFGKEVSINDLAIFIKNTVDNTKSKVILSEPRPGDVQRLVSNNKLASEILGYESEVSLQEGLELLKNWYGSDVEKIKNLLKDEVEKNWIN